MRFETRWVTVAVVGMTAGVLGPVSVSLAQCEVEWGPGFPLPGVGRGAYAVVSYDDGSGPALYVGGQFRAAGSAAADRIAKWDGQAWSGVGGGMSGVVRALAVYEDGTGPALYAGGSFTTAGGVSAARIARWNGEVWSALGDGPGLVGGEVQSLAVFDDDGPGPRPPGLYAGGTFTYADGVLVNGIARWDGAGWSGLAGGMEDTNGVNVYSMAVFDDDGAGPRAPALYAGGTFLTAGGTGAAGVARWDGSQWSPLGSGIPGVVSALAVYDRGTGPALYAGGYFFTAGGVNVGCIARWFGTSWSSVGNGLYQSVSALTVFDDDGAGPRPPALYIGGIITVASGVYVNNLARYSGLGYSTVGGGTNNRVAALGVFDGGNGPVLVAGGEFTRAGDVGVAHVGAWNGTAWSALGEGVADPVYAIEVFDDGAGEAAFCATSVTLADGTALSGVVRWDGVNWRGLGTAATGRFRYARTLAHADGAGGPLLYAAGQFERPDGTLPQIVARWNGTAWEQAGGELNGWITVLAVYDRGNGTEVCTGGSFTVAGGVSAMRIARLSGGNWVAMGAGLDGDPNALALYDDGLGGAPALYVGGSFANAGGQPANRIARWDGRAWSAVGAGQDGTVYSMVVFGDEQGPSRLIVGSSGSSGVSAWDGVSWSTLGSPGGAVRPLASIDLDGSGPMAPALYAGLRRWTGSTWLPIGSVAGGSTTGVYAMTTIDLDGAGPEGRSILVGGDFRTVNGEASSCLAVVSVAGSGPVLADLPAQIVAAPWSTVTITVEDDGTSPIAYQWRRNGVPVPADRQGRATITIYGARRADSGVYDVVVSNLCGSTLSTATLVTVVCDADWNRSATVDSQDFFDFLGDFFLGHADFNQDHRTDSADFLAFLSVFFGECA